VQATVSACASLLYTLHIFVVPKSRKYFLQALLNQGMVDAPSIDAFKSRLCYIRYNRVGFFMD